MRRTVSFVTLQWLRIGIVYSYAYTATNPKLQTFNDIWRAAKCDGSQKTRKIRKRCTEVNSSDLAKMAPGSRLALQSKRMLKLNLN